MVGSDTTLFPGGNAVAAITAAHPFLVKHQPRVAGVLSCFDRMIFRGHLPLSYPKGLEGFLYQQKVLLKHFKDYAPQLAERVKAHVKELVFKAGAPFRHLPTKEPMEEQARALAREKGIREGIVCGYSQLETCRTFRFEYTPGRPRLRPDYRRCTVLYVFLMHPLLGLIHVKLQTWLPLTMQVYCNGHDFLARKLTGLGVKYALHDNAFTWIADVPAAQACADRLVKQNWPKLLGALARQFNPLVGQEIRAQDYYWVMDQVEYATDVLFTDERALAAFYPRLWQHAQACFGAEDVLKFFGRKLTASFRGEVQTWVKRRPEGVRVNHSLKSNRLKMYDKAGSVLRIETTLNAAREFKVRRRNRRGELEWQPLRKGVAWLWRYAEVSRASNSRYLAALSVVDDDSAARRLLDRATRPARLNGRRRRALQPLSPQDQALFLAALRGEHRLRGFRNADLRARLYPQDSRDAGERRRRCARVTRLIQLLRAHGLAAKIPRTRRYRLTTNGEALMSAALYIRHQHLPKELHDAA
jgi:hypothetical protein